MYSCVRFLIEMVHCAGRTRGVIYTVDAGPSSAATDADSRGRLNFFPPLTKHRTHGQSCETTAPLLVNTAQRGATADIYSDGARRNIIKMVSRETSMLFASPLTPLSPLRQVIADAYTADETDCVESLLIGLALKQAMRILGEQFVMGRTIEEALARSTEAMHREYRHSFDMLGEAALTERDAERYTAAYLQAILHIAAHPGAQQDTIFTRPSISVKLSALHPRYEYAQQQRVMAELLPRLIELVRAAKHAGIGITLDAEEADRLDISLDLFKAALRASEFAAWEGLGLAVQAYQKRALPVLNWLIDLSRAQGKRIPVRLVKGAYWDSEIKRAQQLGLPGYPVYTRKGSTDVSYLACAKRMIDARDAIFPQFATHNAHSVAAILEVAGRRRDFEFQRLHGMGEALYHEVLHRADTQLPCRVYAPVGSHEDLLPYLVRRLLENGANTSFVHRLEDERTPIDVLVADPVAEIDARVLKPPPCFL